RSQCAVDGARRALPVRLQRPRDVGSAVADEHPPTVDYVLVARSGAPRRIGIAVENDRAVRLPRAGCRRREPEGKKRSEHGWEEEKDGSVQRLKYPPGCTSAAASGLATDACRGALRHGTGVVQLHARAIDNAVELHVTDHG